MYAPFDFRLVIDVDVLRSILEQDGDSGYSLYFMRQNYAKPLRLAGIQN
jgi:hypothetical protein